MNQTINSIKNRRSIRQFRDKQLTDEELHEILEAGLNAPSGHNDQSWYFTVIKNKEIIREISDGSKAEMKNSKTAWVSDIGKNENLSIFHNAPCVIIVSSKKDAISPIADVCAAIENMMIAAESLDIGSCWIGFAKFYFTSQERYKQLKIPEGYEMYYAISLGYKPDNYKMIPPARKYEKYYDILE